MEGAAVKNNFRMNVIIYSSRRDAYQRSTWCGMMKDSSMDFSTTLELSFYTLFRTVIALSI